MTARGARVVVGVLVATCLIVPIAVDGAAASVTDVVVAGPELMTSQASAPTPAAPAAPAHHRLATPYTGHIFAIGDSVMLGSRRCMPQHGITADAAGNRQPYQGAAVLTTLRSRLPQVVIVHLGTNGGIDRAWIDAIMRTLGHQRRVVWVTLQLRNDYTRYRYEDSSNLELRQVVLRYPNTRVADWNAYTERHRGLVGGDGIHLTQRGCTAYASLLDSVARAA